MTATNDRPLGRKLPTRLMCERYGVVDRTINRWEKTGVIPQAEWINGRKYLGDERVEKRDREPRWIVARQRWHASRSIPVYVRRFELLWSAVNGGVA